MKHIVLAITGASGAPIGFRLFEALLRQAEVRISLLVSDQARVTSKIECGIDLGQDPAGIRARLSEHFELGDRVNVYDNRNMAAQVSSGSCPVNAMIVAPCSMSTLSCIAHGINLNLIHRAASVTLKEKRTLILVPRESPLSPIHLENMLKLSRLGVHLVPPTTAFYNRPQTVQDMVDFICARVLDLAEIPHVLSRRWGSPALNPLSMKKEV